MIIHPLSPPYPKRVPKRLRINGEYTALASSGESQRVLEKSYLDVCARSSSDPFFTFKLTPNTALERSIRPRENTPSSSESVTIPSGNIPCQNDRDVHEAGLARPSVFPSVQSPATRIIVKNVSDIICLISFSPTSVLVSSSSPSSFPLHPPPLPTLDLPPASAISPTSSHCIASPHFEHFIQRLFENIRPSSSVVMLALNYLWRLQLRAPGSQSMGAKPGSEYKMAVAAVMTATKFLEDKPYSNKVWALVSGFTTSEIARLEFEFLSGLGFELFVDEAMHVRWLWVLRGLFRSRYLPETLAGECQLSHASRSSWEAPPSPICPPVSKERVLSTCEDHPRKKSHSPFNHAISKMSISSLCS